MNDTEYLIVGKISGVFGIKGWVKVFSYTQPRDNILNYRQWFLKKGSAEKKINVIAGQLQGKAVVAALAGIDDRDQAAELNGWTISINRTQLPKASAGEYYWADLIKLNVLTTDGIELGVVDHLLETGANDVLVVLGERERLIPFLMNQTIVSIDLDQRQIVVDWDPEF